MEEGRWKDSNNGEGPSSAAVEASQNFQEPEPAASLWWSSGVAVPGGEWLRQQWQRYSSTTTGSMWLVEGPCCDTGVPYRVHSCLTLGKHMRVPTTLVVNGLGKAVPVSVPVDQR